MNKEQKEFIRIFSGEKVDSHFYNLGRAEALKEVEEIAEDWCAERSISLEEWNKLKTKIAGLNKEAN